jgi:hypothetical protein
VALSDTAAQGKTDSGSGILLLIAMQPLKHSEDAFGVTGIDADAIVLDNDLCSIPDMFRAHPDLWRGPLPDVLERIGEKILQKLCQQVDVRGYHQIRLIDELGPRLRNRKRQVLPTPPRPHPKA